MRICRRGHPGEEHVHRHRHAHGTARAHEHGVLNSNGWKSAPDSDKALAMPLTLTTALTPGQRPGPDSKNGLDPTAVAAALTKDANLEAVALESSWGGGGGRSQCRTISSPALPHEGCDL
jgi:hypothetical protein